jgi:hypothetical protein
MKNKLTHDYLEKKLFTFIFRKLFDLPNFFMETAKEPVIVKKRKNQYYKNSKHHCNYHNPISFYQIAHIPNSRICYLLINFFGGLSVIEIYLQKN